jgi:hypothetical protein
VYSLRRGTQQFNDVTGHHNETAIIREIIEEGLKNFGLVLSRIS